jgi:hypothetical protein
LKAARWKTRTFWTSGSTENASLESRETLYMGVIEAGYKKVPRFTQATAERAEPVIELLRDLIRRGLTFEEGVAAQQVVNLSV